MLTERHRIVALAHVSNVLGSVLDARRAADVIGVSVGHKSMRNFHLVLRRNPENFTDVPGRINHRCLAAFHRADEINVIVHRTDFDLFEIK